VGKTRSSAALESTPVGSDAAPLCIDLDGTLVKIDTLHESAVAAVLSDWRLLFRLPLWLTRGRARLKQELALRWRFDPASLPYNKALLAYLEEQRARHRELVLVTAADRRIAERIGEHLQFDHVMASDGVVNLSGRAKATALCETFGEREFDYAGNGPVDHAIWRASARAIIVNAPAAVQRAARSRYSETVVIDDRRPKLLGMAKALRPHQWVKNLLTLVPIVTSGQIATASTLWRTLGAFLAFCAVASAIYVFNDICDLAADRAHPRKRRRPFASGDVSVAEGLALLPVLIFCGTVLGWMSGALTAVVGYSALALLYSMRLKEHPLVDVFVLAALYTIRLIGGGQASGHPVSLWLLAFSGFLFLSLALVKRVSELLRHVTQPGVRVARRGYSTEDLSILQTIGCASTFASAVVLSLYVQSDIASRTYERPAMLWGLIPLLLFWQCRVWLSTARGYMQDDPIVYAVRDWASWIVVISLGALVLLAHLPGVGF
jgi:4-hydroxybenzoate polyprenyltransferase/phosphoserine phosphatase